MDLSWAHVHLIFNHFPIIGAILGFLLLGYAALTKSEQVKQASYWGFIFIALTTILAYFAGTQAAAAVSDVPNVAGIHQHKQVAQQSLIALEILGVLSIGGLFLFRGAKKTPSWFTITMLIVTLAAAVLASWAGILGGKIRHTEIRGELDFLAPVEAEEGGHSHGGSGSEQGHSEGTGSSQPSSMEQGTGSSQPSSTEQGNSEGSGDSHEHFH